MARIWRRGCSCGADMSNKQGFGKGRAQRRKAAVGREAIGKAWSRAVQGLKAAGQGQVEAETKLSRHSRTTGWLRQALGGRSS